MEKYVQYLIPILCSVITAVVSSVISRISIKKDFEKIEKSHELDMKKIMVGEAVKIKDNALLTTLEFLDDYFSFYYPQDDNIISKKLTDQDLTVMANVTTSCACRVLRKMYWIYF